MTARSRNIVVGLVVLGALVALAWMILKFSSQSATEFFSQGLEFTMTSDRADGISEGSTLLYLGVPTGRVTKVTRKKDNSGVIISGTLNKDESLPKNVVGFIRSQSALSMAASISLETEGPPSPEPLSAGATVPVSNQNVGMIPPEFTDIARIIRDQQLVENLNSTVIEIRTQVHQAGEMITSINNLVGDPKLREDLSTSMAGIRTTSENLSQFSGELKSLSGETSATLKQVRTTLSDGSQKFDGMSKQIGDRLDQLGKLLDTVNGIAVKIDKGQGTAGALVADPRLYESLVDTSKTLNLTITDLRRLVEQWEQEGFTLKLK